MSWVSGNRYLTSAEQQNNAVEVWRCLSGYGCTLNGVAAICANMQAESTLNPGIWENLTPTTIPDVTVGYGLCQWTPWSKYADWAGTGWENNGDKECARIKYEADNGIQWFENYSAPNIGFPVFPPITFWQMLTSTGSVEDLASYFLLYYEHPRESLLPSANAARRSAAVTWYNYLQNIPPSPGHIPIWLLFKLKERNFNKG